MNLEAIRARLTEIRTLLKDNADGIDIAALETEVNDLQEQERMITESEQQRTQLLSRIGAGTEPQTRTVVRTPAPAAAVEYDSASPEYREAFFRTLQGVQLTPVQERAFVHTTANTDAVLPKQTLDGIWSQMAEQHPILGDVNKMVTGAVVDFIRHTAIVDGDAASVAEGVANDDEENTFVRVTISGKDFSKHIDLSYRLKAMAIDAFEAYIVKEISDRLASALAADVIAQIKTDLAAANKVPTAAATLAKADLLAAFGKIKNAGSLVVYAGRNAIYNSIFALEGADGLVAFVGNYQDAPLGRLLGATIKQEDALGDDEILILDPKQFNWVVVQDIMIERDRDIKRHVETIAGFAIAGGTLMYDDAGCLLTITDAG